MYYTGTSSKKYEYEYTVLVFIVNVYFISHKCVYVLYYIV